MYWVKKCKICGADRFFVLKKYLIYPNDHRDLAHLAGSHSDITIHLLMCRRCGFIFHNHLLSIGELKKMYEQEDRITEKKETHQKRILLKRSSSFLKRNYNFLSISRVIDVGSGDFSLLDELIKHSPSTTFDAVNVSFTSDKRGSIHVFRTMIEDMLVSDSYHLIILSHVLEHIADFDTFFRHLSKLMHPRAELYIEVPFQVGPALFLNRGFHAQHINYFTPWTLERLLAKYGYHASKLEFDTEGGYYHYGVPGVIRAKFSKDTKHSYHKLSRTQSVLRTGIYLFNPFIFVRGALKTLFRMYVFRNHR